MLTLTFNNHRITAHEQIPQWNPQVIGKLGLLGTLHEHHGCVNRLAWSDDGSLLASCSDDLQVALWRVERGRTVTTFATTHTDNILGIKFMPNSGGHRIVTGAIDGVVELHHLSDSLSERIHVDRFLCHR